jgi:hypothetical protein
MGVVTAAVIGAAATAGSIGYSAYSASQTPSGPGANPTISQLPQDPLSKAQRDYYARMTMSNLNSVAPTFGSVLATGGTGPGGGADMSTAKFPLVTPGMTPNEAAAFGFVGGHGEQIPYVNQGAAAASQGGPGGTPGQPGGMTLSPEQTMYMARERARIAGLTGQKPGPWATNVLNTNERLGDITDRLNALQAIQDPTQHQQNVIGRLTTRQQNVQGRQSNQLGGPLGTSSRGGQR